METKGSLNDKENNPNTEQEIRRKLIEKDRKQLRDENFEDAGKSIGISKSIPTSPPNANQSDPKKV